MVKHCKLNMLLVEAGAEALDAELVVYDLWKIQAM